MWGGAITRRGQPGPPPPLHANAPRHTARSLGEAAGMNAAICGAGRQPVPGGGRFLSGVRRVWLLDFPESGYRAMMIGFTVELAAVLPLRVWMRLRRLQTPEKKAVLEIG